MVIVILLLVNFGFSSVLAEAIDVFKGDIGALAGDLGGEMTGLSCLIWLLPPFKRGLHPSEGVGGLLPCRAAMHPFSGFWGT